jgi:hypothetical protein
VLADIHADEEEERIARLERLRNRSKWMTYDNSHLGLTDERFVQRMPDNIHERFHPLPPHAFAGVNPFDIPLHALRTISQDDPIWQFFGAIPGSIRASSLADMLHLFDSRYKDELDLSPFMVQKHGDMIDKWQYFAVQDAHSEYALPNSEPDPIQQRNFNYGHHHENNAAASFLRRFPKHDLYQIGTCVIDEASLATVCIRNALTGARFAKLSFVYICSADFVARWTSKSGDVKYAPLECKSRVCFVPGNVATDDVARGESFPGLDWKDIPYIKSFSHFKGYYIPQIWSEKLIISQHFPNVRDKTYAISWTANDMSNIFAIKYSERAVDIMFTLLEYIVGRVRAGDFSAARVGHFRDPEVFGDRRVVRMDKYAPVEYQRLHHELVVLIQQHALNGKTYNERTHVYTNSREETRVLFGGSGPPKKIYTLPDHPPETSPYVVIHAVARLTPSSLQTHVALLRTRAVERSDDIKQRMDNLSVWMHEVPEMAIFAKYAERMLLESKTDNEAVSDFPSVKQKMAKLVESVVYNCGIRHFYRMQATYSGDACTRGFKHDDHCIKMAVEYLAKLPAWSSVLCASAGKREDEQDDAYVFRAAAGYINQQNANALTGIRWTRLNLLRRDKADPRHRITGIEFGEFKDRICANVYKESLMARLFYIIILVGAM